MVRVWTGCLAFDAADTDAVSSSIGDLCQTYQVSPTRLHTRLYTVEAC